jgi:multicomponent Na+:H+ antiporter subunit E
VSGGARVRSAALRLAGFGAAWMVLTGGSTRGWPVALATMIAATGASIVLVPAGSWRWRPLALVRFVPFFLGHSVRAGIDVALRALRPSLPIRPAVAVYAMRLPAGTARTFFAGVVSLFPGTVSLEVRGDELHVHLLDAAIPPEQSLRELERRVAELFGVEDS